jgi:hypothetical protein
MQDRDGMTAVHCACVRGRFDTVAVLLPFIYLFVQIHDYTKSK